ncbi:3563_t:CDS:2 [Diversispora eburnea]|uniref:3563_t:CDS:1 n=1 Tax=Diversispora eburnea TaxID=1213867 RepID=A0A9N9A8K5_9GLOM|nr:3563_t:CDS:2 [Diversispora eburnea]
MNTPTKFDFKNYEFCSDFSIFVINDENSIIGPKEYKVHRFILSQQSQYFKVLFESSQNFTEHKSKSVTIKLKDPYNVFPSILNYMYTEILSVYAEFQDSGFENIISDRFLAISFDKLWELDPDIFPPQRLERILKSEFAKFKSEDQKLSIVKKIVEEYYGEDGYDIEIEERWNLITLNSVLPYPLEKEEGDEGEFQEIKAIEGVSERLKRNAKIYNLFQLVDFSLLNPDSWADAFADKMIPNELVVQGLYKVLKDDTQNNETNIKNFLDFLDSENVSKYFDQFSFEIKSGFNDITIHINDNKTYEFHKIILSKESEFFCQLFSSQQITHWIFPWDSLHPDLSVGFISMIHLLYDPNSITILNNINNKPNDIKFTNIMIPILTSSMLTRSLNIISKCFQDIYKQNYLNFILLGCGKLDDNLSKLSEHQKFIRKFVIEILSMKFLKFHDIIVSSKYDSNNNLKCKDISKDFIKEILEKIISKERLTDATETLKISLFNNVFEEWFPNTNPKFITFRNYYNTEILLIRKQQQKNELNEIRHWITRYIDHKKLKICDIKTLSKKWWMPSDLFNAWLVELAKEKINTTREPIINAI